MSRNFGWCLRDTIEFVPPVHESGADASSRWKQKRCAKQDEHHWTAAVVVSTEVLGVGLFGGIWRRYLTEVLVQRCDERVGLCLGCVEAANEAGEGPAAPVELEAVGFQRIHCRARQLE